MPLFKKKKTTDSDIKPAETKKETVAIYHSSVSSLINPLITEKTRNLAIKENKYVFIVSRKANKKEIKQAIKDVYGIKPLSVKTVKVGGKERRYGKVQGKTVGYKKAIVALPKGETIQLYDGV